MNAKVQPKLDYRPEIDSLRAVAVVSVVLYHLGFEPVSGGFVGVDVFFVISGYLITRLLINEKSATGRINFSHFYIRRLRRLFPALLFTLATSTCAAVYLFSSQTLQAFGGSLLHAIFSLSNIHFFLQSGYFDIDASLKPLLHTWSLSVEEQFYLVWPVLLLLMPLSKVLRWLSLLGLLLGSLFFSMWMINQYPSAVFYLIPFRVFEFLVGALVGQGVGKSPNLSRNTLHNASTVIGLGLIFYSVFFFSENTVFPGFNALIPCLGTALFIHSSNRASVSSMLSNRLTVGLGKISYSLYLVHWPLIVFYKYSANAAQLTYTEIAVLILSSLVFATLMFFFVEQPFRSIRKRNVRFLITNLALSLTLSLAATSIWLGKGWEWRPWVGEQISNEEIQKSKQRVINAAQTQAQQSNCTLINKIDCNFVLPDRVNALIIGDSHAIDAFNAIKTVFPSHNLSISGLGGCQPHPAINTIKPPNAPNIEKCKQLNKAHRYKIDYLQQYDYIVINTFLNVYKSHHLINYLSFLKENGIDKVIFFGGYFTADQEMPELVRKFGRKDEEMKDHVRDDSTSDAALNQVANKLGFFFISKRDKFCDGEQCSFFSNGGVPFTYDRHHLTHEFSSTLAVDRRAELAEYVELRPELED